ncbi:importin alpha [Anaeramoeba flamelloides]|uniref:Importin alpha n=1 Tax=Anaeramoeba flamelloides TaxID=1746091 RepID=A0AAV7Z395_9EUKA|nr:importin alpha [Anaeramoeba flamelloides]
MSYFQKKLEKRKKKYFKTRDHQTSMDRRATLSFTLSKRQRERKLQRLRFRAAPTSLITPSIDVSEWEKLPKPQPNDLFRYQGVLNKGEQAQVYKHIILVRKLVTKGTIQSCNMVIASGIIEHLIGYLSKFEDPYLQLESVRIFGQIADINPASARILYEYEIIPKLIKILTTKKTEIFEHAIWILGSMAQKSEQYREEILKEKDSIKTIMNALNFENPPTSLLKYLSFALFALSHTNNIKFKELLNPCVEFFLKSIFSENLEIVKDCCWGLANLTTNFTEFVNKIKDGNTIEKFNNILESNNQNLQIPIFKCIGNIIYLNEGESENEIYLSNKNMGIFKDLFDQEYNNNNNQKPTNDIYWTLSNICKGSEEQIQIIIDNEFIPFIIDHIKYENYPIKMYLIFCLSNICLYGSNPQLDYLLNFPILKIFCDALLENHAEQTFSSLKAIEALLYYGKILNNNQFSQKVNPIYQRIQSIYCENRITKQINNNIIKISKLSSSIHDQYFNINDESNDFEIELEN